MSPEEIVAKFAEALELFKPIEVQPSIRNHNEIYEVLIQLLLQILFNETEGQSRRDHQLGDQLSKPVWPSVRHSPACGCIQ